MSIRNKKLPSTNKRHMIQLIRNNETLGPSYDTIGP